MCVCVCVCVCVCARKRRVCLHGVRVCERVGKELFVGGEGRVSVTRVNNRLCRNLSLWAQHRNLSPCAQLAILCVGSCTSVRVSAFAFDAELDHPV